MATEDVQVCEWNGTTGVLTSGMWGALQDKGKSYGVSGAEVSARCRWLGRRVLNGDGPAVERGGQPG